MESFFQTHAYLIEQSCTATPVRRTLMDIIDWSYRLIGIRGPRGVGKTSFLLDYARENFDVAERQCIYINISNFYFQARGIIDFAREFSERGGQVLLIDQIFTLPGWRQQLCECYHRFPLLRIVYTTTSVEGPEDINDELSSISRTYVLHGFSFREYLNLRTGNSFHPYTLSEILNDHERILKTIVPRVHPWLYFEEYIQHGYYPFYLESNNFTEKLLKSMNQMIETDILLIKQVELKYLNKIKKLLYLLATSDASSPNVSKFADEIQTSRATVMNYLKYLEEARLINMVYREGETFPKKPSAIMLHDPNLMHAVYSPDMQLQDIMEAYFVNTLWRHNTINSGKRDGLFRINNSTDVVVCDKNKRIKQLDNVLFARYNSEVGQGNDIPIWLFGFLY